MDLSLIAAAGGALKAAIDIGKTAVGLRDDVKLQGVIAAMNNQLLEAQQSLFAHNTELLALQQQHFQTTQELREAKEALAERGSYSLFQIVPGSFVYRPDIPPEVAAGLAEGPSEPDHYICQPCFDGPGQRKVVLRYTPKGPGHFGHWDCPACKNTVVDRPGGSGPRVRARRAIY